MSKVISAQVSDDVAEEIDDLRDGDPPEYDEPRSAIVRRLVLDSLDDSTTEDRQSARQLTVVFGLLYIAVYSLGDRTALITIFGVYLVAMIAWTFAPVYRDWQSETDD